MPVSQPLESVSLPLPPPPLLPSPPPTRAIIPPDNSMAEMQKLVGEIFFLDFFFFVNEIFRMIFLLVERFIGLTKINQRSNCKRTENYSISSLNYFCTSNASFPMGYLQTLFLISFLFLIWQK